MKIPASGAYVARETAISVVINVVISLLFVWLVFGGDAEAARQDVLIDFIPQTFMIALMGSLIPAAITRGKLNRGAVARIPGPPSRLPHNLFLRSLLIAVAATLVVGGAAAILTVALLGTSIDLETLTIVKACYGALVALIVTPPALRAALRDQRAGQLS